MSSARKVCKECKRVLSSFTGVRKVKHGYVCDDCYFYALSRIVAKNPIITPENE